LVAPRGDEEILDVSIGGNVQWGVVAVPRLIAIHLGGKVEEEFLAEALEPLARVMIVASRLPSTILAKSMLWGSQLTRRMRPAAKSARVPLPVQSAAHP
jgi:hypothetical protein